MTCPACGAPLNVCGARDAVEVVPCGTSSGRIEWRARVATVYACSACEFIGTKPDVAAAASLLGAQS